MKPARAPTKLMMALHQIDLLNCDGYEGSQCPPRPSPPHTAPLASWRHETSEVLPPSMVFDRWRRRVHTASRDARLSTGYARH